jgi:hypothetical protein
VNSEVTSVLATSVGLVASGAKDIGSRLARVPGNPEETTP